MEDQSLRRLLELPTSGDLPWAVRARFVLPVTSPPLDGGCVTIQGDRIIAVGLRTDAPTERTVDLGACALLPGLVNAHTHLEFSDLREPLGTAGLPLPEWIRLVVAQRRERTDRSAAIRLGLEESLRAGVTCVGEIATQSWPDGLSPDELPQGVVFREALGLSQSRADEQRALVQQHFETAGNAAWQAGVSPHAPYTVRWDLFCDLVQLAARRRASLALHLAESAEELQLLEAGAGPLRDLLADLGAWTEGAIPLPARPLDYLCVLAQSDVRGLVIHGNYLDAAERALLAEHAARLTLVYCPRTHARFGHPRYPLGELLQQGVRVAIATDSRASNPDLSLWEDLRFAARTQPQVSPAAILRCGTLTAAEALGRSDRGALAAGWRADLLAVPFHGASAGDPLAALWADERSRADAVWLGGRLVVEAGRSLGPERA